MQKGLLRPRHRDDEGARRLEDRKDRSCNCRRCPEDRRCTLTFPMHRQAAVRRPAQDQRRIVQRFRADGRRPSCVGRAHNPETPWRCRGSFGSRSLTISPSMRISPPGASSARDHTQDGALAAARWPDEHHNYSGNRSSCPDRPVEIVGPAHQVRQNHCHHRLRAVAVSAALGASAVAFPPLSIREAKRVMSPRASGLARLPPGTAERITLSRMPMCSSFHRRQIRTGTSGKT